ncbi:MAG: DMT family transporter [Clostridia bacterium]|nr:DMT family transporter [Clostridia bacterium]
MSKFKLSGGMIVFIGAALWSLNSPLVKFLSLDSVFICALRAAIAAVTLLPFLRPKKLKFNPWMILYLVSYAALCLCVVFSLKLTSAPIAIGMQYTSVVWIFIIDFIITRKFDKHLFVPILIIMVGTVLFMCSGTDKATNLGNLVALAEGFLFMLMTISVKKASGDNPVGLVALANVFTAITVFLIFPSSLSGFGTMTGLDWVIMIILGAVQVGGGYAFYTLGTKMTSPQKASIIALWEMILGPVWVAIFLREYPSPMVIAGFVVILAGIVLHTLADIKKSAELKEKSNT